MTAGSWIGELPSTWTVRRLGTLGTFAKGSGGSKEDNRESGLAVVRYGELYTAFDRVIREPQSFIDPAAASRYTPLRTGSLVFAGSGEDPEEIGKAALSLLPAPAYVGGDSVIFTPRPGEIDAGFLTYVLDSKPLKAYKAIRSTGFTVVHISAGKLKTLPIPLPSPEEQKIIVGLLDEETTQIDALVAKQEEFIGLLRERRSRSREALADRVAEGHRLRWSMSEVDRRAGARAVDLPLMSVSIDWGVRRRDETTDKLSRAEDLSHYKVCLEGDIVVNRMRAFQGALGVAPEDGIVSPDYAVLRVAHGVAPDWLAELMRTKAFVGEIIRRLRGIGGMDSGNVRTPRINTADLLDIRADIPEERVQHDELSGLRERTSRIDALIAKAEEHIALAKERRSALITAAVTGQIDVRTARKAN